MNQTRLFLIFAWLMVAALLWMEWSKEHSPAASATSSAATTALPPASATSAGTAGMPPIPRANVPGAGSGAGTTAETAAPAAGATRVTVTTDVLRLTMDGSSVLDADLLMYPQTQQPSSPPVQLLTEDALHPYNAISGWIGERNSPSPSLGGFRPEQPGKEYVLAKGQDSLEVPFVWNGPSGISIRRVYTLQPGHYAVQVRDEIVNHGSKPWQGYVFRKLSRVPTIVSRGMTNPDSFSFNGATWFSPQDGYQRRAFKDYLADGPLNQTISGGWIAVLQHHFFTSWIPQADQQSVYLLSNEGPLHVIEARGPAFVVVPGGHASTEARLWVGPKLVNQIAKEQVKGLDRVVDYSRFSLMALLGQGLFWILSHLHALLGNWGWSIVGLVLLLKLLLYPLSSAQYKSSAKLRKFQPRMQQLKERYGDDKQKLQTAMMELYKKEKINPMGGCLPVLIQMPIFFALYWVLVESVELRQAPWFAWIQDLTARDPYFILPVINAAVMLLTQKLTPTPGMDPAQAKMMQFMPLVFGVMMAFVPSGLVLYWVTNGSLGLLQQWWMNKRHGEAAASVSVKPPAKAKK
ncbi:membrane protein insertase YidC [Xanthomonas albilineans]|uniref:Membrane protein insertase YidC n=1 Tax=Xanthomonas albilineans (strain GPE PC73 / CFBP 7063) TaxID=380358 RepID=D2UGY9_XANAP|nr:membrane protein insertase YidC [Xanthomonas albilineans]QHQ29920.1 putative inner-membrane protein oxaa [Xanthomonas albilineans]CBA17650.1 probable inner-membrane protein oxaa [Xanthomonas albilineans GPE PC73]